MLVLGVAVVAVGVAVGAGLAGVLEVSPVVPVSPDLVSAIGAVRVATSLR